MLNKKELKARIEDEEKLLQFYVRYEEEITEMTSYKEWEVEVDECLDILIELYRLLKTKA
jgi:hypothetical protein